MREPAGPRLAPAGGVQTAGLQAAINRIGEAGGGVLLLQPGRFHRGATEAASLLRCEPVGCGAGAAGR